jgi:DNA-directed RNA polymerase subunit H (RpoH/RPB5)
MNSDLLITLYEKYQNIILSLSPEYKNWKLLDAIYSDADFKNNMSQNQYIMHTAFNPDEQIFIYVVLFHNNSTYLVKTDIFRRFLDLLTNKVHKQDLSKKQKFLENYYANDTKKNKMIEICMANNKKFIESIFITKQPLTTYYLRNIQAQSKKIKLVVHNYLHKHFLLDISRAPLCGKHIRLTKNQSIHIVSSELMTSPYNLPRILITDPHVIWIGAKVGELIKIIRPSEMAGLSISYRIVVPPSGKIMHSEILDDDEVDDADNSDNNSLDDKNESDEDDTGDIIEVAEEEDDEF